MDLSALCHKTSRFQPGFQAAALQIEVFQIPLPRQESAGEDLGVFRQPEKCEKRQSLFFWRRPGRVIVFHIYVYIYIHIIYYNYIYIFSSNQNIDIRDV